MAQHASITPVRTTSATRSADSRRVIRVCTFPVPVFDLLKDFQRQREEQLGRSLTNSETLSLIITEHAATAAKGGC